MGTLAYRLALTLVLVVGGSATLTAQSGAGRVELGAYGAFTRYSGTTVRPKQQPGAGGRIGLFVSRIFSVEASGDLTETESDLSGSRLTVARLGGTVVATTRMGVYAGVGYERLFYRAADDFDDNGVHVILGDRLPLGGRAALRLEGRLAYFPSSPRQNGSDAVFNLGGTAGISIFAFGGTPRDADGDGVRDQRDQCPGTPAGLPVDPVGCPADSDGDRVFDGRDDCPDTPLGATVDEAGCPSDDDGDTVFNGIDECPGTPLGARPDARGCPTDQDEDTVFDGIDQCPDTPFGAEVDELGCPGDADADGVYNGIDQCPGTPAGAAVNSFGCTTDDDADGVPNELDQCPATPPNMDVDAVGCPPTDSDGDGVFDGADRCPNTSPGRQVDEIGCPILFAVEEGIERPLVLRGVTFATGSARLTPASYAILDEVAGSLLAHPDVSIEVAGHTDSTGPRQLNMNLSRARAEAVRNYLATRGVGAERMLANGYGPDQPVATNRTPQGRAQNRRVELRRIEP